MPLTLDPEIHDQTVAALVNLEALSRQTEADFRSGASQAMADDVRALLRRRCEDSRRQADELQAHARRLGASLPTAVQSLAAPWSVAHSIAPEHMDVAVLEACERAEDGLLEHYCEALSQQLEPAVRDVLQLQRLEIRRQHELLRTLRDRLRGLI